MPLPFGCRQRTEIAPLGEQLPHHPTDHFVRFAKRHPFADEKIGDVGGKQQSGRRGLRRIRKDFEPVDDAGRMAAAQSAV